jgi:L-iditol 2-dehydrogenase
VPAPGPDEVLVEVLANGVCSTDYAIAEGHIDGPWPGMIIGHELVGRVVALGEQALALGEQALASGEQVTQPAIGARVVLDTMIACGACRSCKQGHTELCAQSDELGFTLDGTWSDYAALPAVNLRVLHEGVDDLLGTMLEALTCQMGAVDALQVRFGETTAILGSGLAALCFVQLLRLKGAGHVALLMRDYAERVHLARQFGAEPVVEGLAAMRAHPQVQADEGFDVVIDAVGSQETTAAALSLARRGGRVLHYGLHSAHVDRFPLGETIFRNLTLYGRTSAPWMWGPAMDLVARGDVQLRPMIGGIVEMEALPALMNAPRERGGPLKRIVRVRGVER